MIRNSFGLRPVGERPEFLSPETYWRRMDEDLHRGIVGSEQVTRGGRVDGGERIAAAMHANAHHLRWGTEIYQRLESLGFGWEFERHVIGLCGQVRQGLKTREDVEEVIRLEASVTSLRLDEFELVALVSELRGF